MAERVGGFAAWFPSLDRGWRRSDLVVERDHLVIERDILRPIVLSRDDVVRTEFRGVSVRGKLYDTRIAFVLRDGKTLRTRFAPRDPDLAYDTLERMGWPVTPR